MPAKSKTVLITGTSTGIGRSTARYFQSKGWNVAASMRTPSKETELNKLDGVFCPRLDVTDSTSIQSAIDETVKRFGGIDAVVNNAGYGLSGPFEGASDEQVRRQFETNVFGVMRVTRGILPYFRGKKSGTIVNVASMGGRIVFPLYSLYHATKWAVEGFTESLRYEVEPLGIRVKLIEPGAIKTDFYERSNDTTVAASPVDYQELCRIGFANMSQAGTQGSPPEKVAQAIFKAATDKGSKLRYPVGNDAKAMLFLRRIISDTTMSKLTRSMVFKKTKK